MLCVKYNYSICVKNCQAPLQAPPGSVPAVFSGLVFFSEFHLLSSVIVPETKESASETSSESNSTVIYVYPDNNNAPQQTAPAA